VTAYTTAVNCLKRLHEVLGVERKPHDITPPSLSDYARAVRQRDEGAAA
jgi:hypothetical protein